MDADGRIIPIVEDDQGEGYKDVLDKYDLALKKEMDKLNKKLKKYDIDPFKD